MNEISEANLAELEKRYRTSAMIGLSQIMFALILAVVAWFVVARTEPAETTETVTTLWVLVLFLAVGSFVLRRLFFGWERMRNAALLGGIEGVLKKLQTNSLILGMFAELIAIIGFVITFFTGSIFDIIRALAIAMIVFLITFPRKKIWKTVVTNLQGI